MTAMENNLELKKEKDAAYWERNQLVAALSKIYPSWLERHPSSDKEWEDDWRWIVFIVIPGKEIFYEQKYVQGGFKVKKPRQLSWHIHDSELVNFMHLKYRLGSSWDGHTTEEKYDRLAKLKNRRRKL